MNSEFGVLRELVLLCSILVFASASASTPPPPKHKPAQLQITGYGAFGNRELKRMLRTLELGGKTPEFFDPSFVEDAALILASRIKRDGYLQPAISIHLRLAEGGQMDVQADKLFENPLPRPLRITRAQFKIHTGVLYYFQSLSFEGLQTLPEKQARSFFLETDILFHIKQARIYTPEKLERGLSSLTEILDQQGYNEAKAEVAALHRDDRTGAVRVRIRVRRGAQFIARSVREEYFYGGTADPTETRTVQPNHPYSRLWLQDFSLGLKTNQYHRGYPDVTVTVQTLAREPGPPASLPANHSSPGIPSRVYMDLLASIHSGSQVRIGKIEFKGQEHTKASLMARRVRIQRGDLLDPVRVEQGRYRLAQLGVFDTVELAYRREGDHMRDVLYQVKEGKRLTLSLLFGYGSYELLRGGFEAEENNIWGLAHHARLKAIQSFKSSSGEFTYTIPELIGKDIDLFFDASGLRREEISFTRLEYGGGAGLHKYLQPQATDVTLRYNYQILSAQDFGSVEEVATEGLTNPAVGSVILELKHDRRDNPLYPRRGYKIFATIESATDYLGGDANYERVEISPSWHHPLGGGRYLSLGLSHGIDFSFGSPANNLPFNKRFFPGGDNSIRGYREGEAAPRNSLGQLVGAETYTLGVIELEQALTPRWSVVVFSDSLGFARRIANYPFDTSLFSVGGGIRWRTLIGPIRLEYGHNLNPRPGDPSGTLQFSLGFPF
ncbi:MAG TPA: BamA/TamA family outer membrane protein [Candidatus Binatia bacterium]|nr:BamA/TamA family outer membrane protein [Candidatus Binatia bacterium]